MEFGIVVLMIKFEILASQFQYTIILQNPSKQEGHELIVFFYDLISRAIDELDIG